MKRLTRTVSLVGIASLFIIGADDEDGCDCARSSPQTVTLRDSRKASSAGDGQCQSDSFTPPPNTSSLCDVFTIDPNDYDDVKNNKDKIREATVLEINLRVKTLGTGNKAELIAGQVDVRPAGAGNDAWVEAVSDWSEVPLLIGNEWSPGTDQTKMDRLKALLFGGDGANPVDIRVQGYTRPMGLVDFEFEIEITVQFRVQAF